MKRCSFVTLAEATTFLQWSGFDRIGLAHGTDWRLVRAWPNPTPGGWSVVHARVTRSALRRAQADHSRSVGGAGDVRLQDPTPWYFWSHGSRLFVEEANYNLAMGRSISFFYDIYK